MAVYVDDMQAEAEVPDGDNAVRGRWSHLMADSEAELRAFAKRLGLRESWIQHPGEAGVHFDVTAGKRQQAIKLGAQPITWREAGERYAAAKARERCGDVGRTEHPGDCPDAPRPGEGRVRHSWGEPRDGVRQCTRESCGISAERRWDPAGSRPLVIYTKGDRRVVSERVPPCGSDLPQGISGQEMAHLATAADKAAGKAYRSGDYNRAFRLLTDARVLDPSRSGLWDWHERQLRDSVREVRAAKAERKGPEPPGPGAERAAARARRARKDV